MSHAPIMLLIYGALLAFILDVAWLFYVAYIRDRRKW